MDARIPRERAIRRLNHRSESLRRCPISSIPDEIFLKIFSFLNPLADRHAVSLVCHQFNALMDELLYETIRLRSPYCQHAYVESLAERPRRALDAKAMQIAFRDTTRDYFTEAAMLVRREDGANSFEQYMFLASLERLQHLQIMMPDDFYPVRLRTVFRMAGMAATPVFSNLTNCYLDFRNARGDHWRNHRGDLSVFKIRHLKSLCIRNVRFKQADGMDLASCARSTALEELVLVDSHVDYAALSRIASAPRALKMFILHQKASPHSSTGPLDAWSCFVALRPACSQLKTVVFDSNIENDSASSPEILRDMLGPFTKLQYLGLNEVVLSHSFSSADEDIEDVLPPDFLPNLQVLNFLKTQELTEDTLDSIVAIAQHKPRLFPQLTKILLTICPGLDAYGDRSLNTELECIAANIELKQIRPASRLRYCLTLNEDDVLNSFSSNDGWADEIMRQVKNVRFEWTLGEGDLDPVLTPVMSEGMELLERESRA